MIRQTPRTKPREAWTFLLWAAYVLLAFAAFRSVQSAEAGVWSQVDALGAMALGVVLLVFVPYRWARSQVVTRQEALRMLGWIWNAKLVPLGMAVGILLFAAFASAELQNGAFPWALTALYGVVAACCEEMFFRGHLRQRIGAWQIPAFAVLHSTGGLDGTLVPLLAGMVLTTLARHGLSGSIAAHATFNVLVAVHSV